MVTIRCRAPLRLGIAGGGTDVSPYSDTYGGRILNATIDKYAYAYVRQLPMGVEFQSPDRDRFGTADVRDVSALRTDFPLHVGVYERMIRTFNGGVPVPLRLSTQVDAPPGSGLGSSSTLVVAMTKALADLLGARLDPYQAARLAWEIERVDLGFAGGWQDQYAASFGGFNYLESRDDGRIVVNQLRVSRDIVAELEASILLYFGGVSRDSSEVIAEQQRNVERGDARALDATHAIRREAELMKDCLLTGDIAGMAGSLREGWLAKKQLASRISNEAIERAYAVAAAHGMLAGKVSGAGGGGFMMLIVDPERRLEVSKSLEHECGGVVMTCQFTERGAEVWRAR